MEIQNSYMARTQNVIRFSVLRATEPQQQAKKKWRKKKLYTHINYERMTCVKLLFYYINSNWKPAVSFGDGFSLFMNKNEWYNMTVFFILFFSWYLNVYVWWNENGWESWSHFCVRWNIMGAVPWFFGLRSSLNYIFFSSCLTKMTFIIS